MQWQKIQTSDNEIDWQKDDSGIYSLITWNPSDNVRCDLMSDNHEPLVTFVGTSDNVRKAICKFCSDNQIHLSDQHASYIGRELLIAELQTTSYKQDEGINLSDLYLHTCPETNRIFLCQEKTDNNIAEIFDVKRWSDKGLPM